MNNTLIVDPAFTGLADEISHSLGEGVNIGKVDFTEFPDSWPDTFIHDVAQTIEHQNVTAILDFSKPHNLLRNISVAQSIIDNTANKLRLIIPFFPVGTMERAKKRGEVITANTMADMLSLIGNGREGKTSIHLFDIHDVRIKHFFSRDVNVELHTGMHLVDLSSYDTVAFPDKGAADRFGEYYEGKDSVILDKIRIKGQDKKIITIKEGDPEDKRILLVDDMIQGGGTSVAATEVLRDKGAKTVSNWSTHGVCPNNAHEKVAKVVDRLIVSNSIPKNTERAKAVANMTVESIAPLITRIIAKG